MNTDETLAALRALAHESRLAAFRALVQAGPDGLAVGELREALALPAATLTAHLNVLRGSGLVADTREGRVIRTVRDHARISRMLLRRGVDDGATLTEDTVGNNGIGTALETRAGVFIHGEQHFAELLRDFVCYGHPIIDPLTRRLVGAVNLSVLAAKYIFFSKAGMLAPDGHCRSFDASANGYVPGEGVGAVLLKPLEAALRDRDTIHGVIRATGINQDGRTNGITVPSPRAQRELCLEVYERFGIDPKRGTIAASTGCGLL